LFDNVLARVASPPPPAATHKPDKPSGPIAVSSGVQAARLIKQVVPLYPALARAARVSGTVRLQGVIAKDGSIKNLQLISGHPLLAQAALDAVRQWVYKPTLLNGEAVEVIAPIDVIFTLSQ
jgi:protein TonB